MTIHNNTTTATASISPGSRDQIPSRLNDQVEGVAFDVLFSQTPPPDTEQLRFELKECGKTGSQYYTIATWKGKRYRITVHDNKRKLAYSERDWQQVEDKTITVLDRVQNGKHFFKGTLQLHAKTKNRWKVTHENNIPPVERSVNKKIIREFKNLFESQINHTNILPAAKSPEKFRRASYPSNPLYKPAKKEVNFLEFREKIFEKVKGYLRSLKSNKFERLKNHLYPVRNINNFDNLSSAASSISSLEEINTPKEDDLDDSFSDNSSLSDNTSLGDRSNASSRVSEDSGSSYSPVTRR
ncbi:MAG: hypothetical protein WBD50_04410 [Candidatus Rhabdochlamydia sp.]